MNRHEIRLLAFPQYIGLASSFAKERYKDDATLPEEQGGEKPQVRSLCSFTCMPNGVRILPQKKKECRIL